MDVRSDGAETCDVSVIIVNYNVRAFLEQTLRSVRRASGHLDVEVFVVDNNSVDGSCAMVRERFPEVELIENTENVGFASANNQAIRRARGRYLLILNPDTIVQEDTFDVLVRFMDEHPRAGAVGPTILHPDGTFALVSRRSFPTPTIAFYRMIGLSRLFPRSRTFGRYNMTYLPEDETAEVDALCGCCMMVRRRALYEDADDPSRTSAGSHGGGRGDSDAGGEAESQRPGDSGGGAGLLDEDYFMYGEDLDWCYSMQESGWKVYYTPETRIIHYKGESTKKGELRYVRLFYKAMLQFVDKHFEGRHSGVFSGLLRAGIFLRAALAVLQRWTRKAAPAVMDLLVVAATVSSVAVGYDPFTDVSFGRTFFLTIVPAYALATVFGIFASRGYRTGHLYDLRPAAAGTTVGFVFVSVLSFFVKQIAFSRAIVGLSYPLSLVLLAGWRLFARRGERGTPRVLLVGRAEEMARLTDLLAQHPDPPMQLVGYVPPDHEEAAGSDADHSSRATGAAGGVDDASQSAGAKTDPSLGRLTQLRDLVRLRAIDEVLFAAEGLSNHLLFHLVQQLKDLPVQVKILAEERSHVIGKASMYDLTAPAFLDAEEAIGPGRNPLARRAWEVLVALLGLLAHPLIWVAARLTTPPDGADGRPGDEAGTGGRAGDETGIGDKAGDEAGAGASDELGIRTGEQALPARLLQRTRQLPDVLAGRRALVGTDSRAAVQPPDEWGLRPGVFAITERLGRPLDAAQARRAYWHYLTHASASLDWQIIKQNLRAPER